ncbi:BrnT family toxin [Novosphingobium sp. Chol11]|uniref:BrnT family toxin n=1 Tax=Novosphingobium sp. Chol11 TaxID=1385763 RepID=UPI0025D99423|nr:BrnT family toxin [Novosphingobium sp. Chol11]
MTLAERGLDLCDAPLVIGNAVDTVEDRSFDYPEDRLVTFGRLRERLIVVVWTPVEHGIRVISMRKANEREQRRYRARMG